MYSPLAAWIDLVRTIRQAPTVLDTAAITRILDAAEAAIPSRELTQFQALSAPLRDFALRWTHGAVGVNRGAFVTGWCSHFVGPLLAAALYLPLVSS